MNAKIWKQKNAAREARIELVNELKKYFGGGDTEHHIGLLSNAIQDIVMKGTDDTDESLDKPFEHTRRYIRESVFDLTQLQKFLLRMLVVYTEYERQQTLLTEAQRSEQGSERIGA